MRSLLLYNLSKSPKGDVTTLYSGNEEQEEEVIEEEDEGGTY